MSGIPFYCTSIAIADGDTVGDNALAYVVNLINGDEFWAEKDQGAFFNGERLATLKDEEFSLVAYEAQSPRKDIVSMLPLLAASRKTRCLGATALDLSLIACGAISVFVNPSPSRTIDFGAGWLLIEKPVGYSPIQKGTL